MLEMKCRACGSGDLYEENGYWVCRFCGTKHLITQDDRAARRSDISLDQDVARLLSLMTTDPSKADKYARMILEIDPNNARARQQLQKKSGCYIATAVYGSYDCPQVWTLRRYRDESLASSWCGRLFIRIYYAISPTLVRLFGHADWFRRLLLPTLDSFVDRLQNRGFSGAPYMDTTWI